MLRPSTAEQISSKADREIYVQMQYAMMLAVIVWHIVGLTLFCFFTSLFSYSSMFAYASTNVTVNNDNYNGS